ncbi:MAG: hypothetical protein WCO00_05930 [Rhodospirillaceae bacterium]
MSASAVLRLRKVGFTAEPVEALADVMDTQAASKAGLGEAAHGLKSQIGAVGHRLEVEITGVRSEISLLRSDMRQIGQRLVLKLGGMMVVLVGVMVTLIQLIPGGHP